MISLTIAVIVLVFLLGAVVVLAALIWRLQRNHTQSDEFQNTTISGSHGLTLDESTGPVLKPVEDHLNFHGHYLGTACKLAYGNETTAAPQFLSRLNLEARLISVDNTQCYVCENAESIVVAFRGSEKPNTLDGFKDWLLTNARNFLVLPEGRIGTDFAAAGVGARFHRGFMAALAEVWEPLLQTVEASLKAKRRPLWITGHSLGGAIALLAAWRFHQKFIEVHRICTFGAPMVGNKAAADAYHREFPNKIVRYVDYCDMVPKLPTISLLSNEYDHVQREILLGGSQDASLAASTLYAQAADASTSPENEVDEQASNTIWNGLHSGIASHLMDNYIARLEELG